MKQTQALLFDGAKTVPLAQNGDWDLGGDLDGVGSRLDTYEAFREVPWLNRAVTLRANALAALPWKLERLSDGADVTTDPAYRSIVRNFKQILWQTEASLCLYGASYVAKEVNRVGKNLTLRWLAPATMEPMYDPSVGLVAFRRNLGDKGVVMGLDRLVFVFVPNLALEAGPGIPPAQTALAAAGLLLATDRYVQGYFKRGVIRATILSVEGNPNNEDMRKLESWWKRMFRGLGKAYETAAVRAVVKPVVVGDSLDETGAPELTAQKREDIATALGVPHSLIFSNAANYATAAQDNLNLYEHTILPQAELIAEAFNAQLFEALGVRLVFEPNKIEAYQQFELQKAQAIAAVVGQPVLSVDEGRALLGYAPLVAAQVEPTLDPAPQPQPQPADTAANAKALDLRRYQTKALKALKDGKSANVKFESEWLDDFEADYLKAALELAATPDAVKAAFEALSFVKAAPSDGLTETERRLYEQLVRVLSTAGAETLRAILKGDEPDYSKMSDELRAALMTVSTEAVLQAATSLADAIGPDFDPAVGATAASEWAQQYSYELVRGLTESTQRLVSTAIAQYHSTPGMTREQVEALLRPAFGEKRAEAIAVTEITRAASQATIFYQNYLRDNGIATERVWNANADDLMCEICRPLHNKPESQWASINPAISGPPAHPRCRCATNLRLRKDGIG